MGAMSSDQPQFTSEDIEALTGGIINAKVLDEWHYRESWLTPIEQPKRGKPYLYDRANLFEAKFRGELVGLGVAQKPARDTLETLLMGEAIGQRRLEGRATSRDMEDDLPRQIETLLETLPGETRRLWAVYFGGALGTRSPVYARTVKDDVPLRKLLVQEAAPFVLVLDACLIAREVLAYQR